MEVADDDLDHAENWKKALPNVVGLGRAIREFHTDLLYFCSRSSTDLSSTRCKPPTAVFGVNRSFYAPSETSPNLFLAIRGSASSPFGTALLRLLRCSPLANHSFLPSYAPAFGYSSTSAPRVTLCL
ncbi:hypothetical protein NMY22_g10366 [Coprinellus aureogranulatus]|nr:hypothetical protein NMY22_g10366 [Coprinellus aureogranulatus]